MALTVNLATPAELVQQVTDLRHDLHAHPELGYGEQRTSETVQAWLKRHQIEFVGGLAGGTGILGFLPATSGPGAKTIAIRADMDALPIFEETGVEYASQTPGIMHACGHDGHTSVLAGTAANLAQTRERRNNLLFIFQPAEEGGAGGKKMVDEGVLAGRILGAQADAVFGLHCSSHVPLGSVATCDGAMLASAGTFGIIVNGRGGHAAAPHVGIDPVVVASQIVLGLQTIASRNVDPLDSIVVSVPMFHAGSAHNVIPQMVELKGTLRTLKNETRELGMRRIEEIATGIATAMGGTAEVTFEGIPYPVTLNDPSAAAQFRRVIGGLSDVTLAQDCLPVMGGEDFSFYGRSGVPACFFWLGQKVGEAPYPEVHTPYFNFNDASIPVGVAAMTALATAELALG